MVCLSEQAIRPLTNHVFCNYCACFDLQKHSSIMIRKKLGRGRLFFTKAGDSATCRKIFCSPSARPCAPRSSQKSFSAQLSFDFSEGFKKKIDFVNNLKWLVYLNKPFFYGYLNTTPSECGIQVEVKSTNPKRIDALKTKLNSIYTQNN